MTEPFLDGGVMFAPMEPTDAEFAKQVKVAVADKLAAVIAEMNIAASRSMEVRFQIGTDGLGRAFLQEIDVLRRF